VSAVPQAPREIARPQRKGASGSNHRAATDVGLVTPLSGDSHGSIVESSTARRDRAHDLSMTDANTDQMHATFHLVQQTTVEFNAADLWPLHGAYSGFGSDLPSFAAEVTRRLGADGCIGFHPDPGTITVIPFSAVKRVDFAVRRR
jgi:hypothetical protein